MARRPAPHLWPFMAENWPYSSEVELIGLQFADPSAQSTVTQLGRGEDLLCSLEDALLGK